MDKEWVRDKLLHAGTEVTDESNNECDAVWLTIPRPSVDDVAEAITQAHEEEMDEFKARMGLAMDGFHEVQLHCGHPMGCVKSSGEGTNYCEMCMMEGTIERLEAQVAVMSEVLRLVQQYLYLDELYLERRLGLRDSGRYVSGEERDRVRAKAVDAIEQALSAAPKVAARLKMRLRREPMGDRYLETTGKDSYLAMGTLRYDETYDVLVMAGEQSQESEQE